ncbi:hypothetical protein MNBD_CHLOROFLEXI01-5115, partial [hydrothermal vent metagenome]
MNSVKTTVASLHKEQNGSRHPLLAYDEYEHIINCLEKAYAQAIAIGDTQRATVLAAAKQLCVSCVRLHHEVSFHQEAYHHSETRRDNLDAELNKLLKMMELVPETAGSPQNHTLWQRMSHFLRPEKQRLIQMPKLTFPVKQENGALGEVETAVSLHPQPATVPLEPAPPTSESS